MSKLSPILAILIGLALTGCQRPAELANVAGAECAHCVDETDAAGDPTSQTSPYATAWLSPGERKAPVPLPSFQDQDGRKIAAGDLRGAPLVLSFIYTRCENRRKCPLVAQTMAELHAQLDRATITPTPRLALVTYDPDYDTPEHLNAFGRTHGMRFSQSAMLLRPEMDAKEQLFKDLNVRVNFNERGVNLHGVQLILLDKQGRFVRAHHTLIWDNDTVLAELKRLAAE